MVDDCLTVEQIRALLAGELAGVVEEQAILHLESCPHCERRAAELSDDLYARQLAHSARDHPSAACWSVDELDELRQRLLAYGLFQRLNTELASGSDPGTAEDGLDSTAGGWEPAEGPPLGGPPTSTPALPAAGTGEQEPDLALTGRRLGALEVVRPLGSGSFGVVFEAFDPQLQRAVAIKVARPSVMADPALRARFLREAQALARLEHPGIVPVYGAEQVGGLCFLVLAYCPGCTLEQYLARQTRPLPPRRAVSLLLPLAEAVAHAHERGILHRDIKPGNILLSGGEVESKEPPSPRLTDFGLAKLMEEKSSDTLAGLVMGTACYMAPEQAAGLRERIGPASDVYALGVVLYELLAGRVPIQGQTTLDTLRRILIEEPLPPSVHQHEVSRDLDAIVLKCLAKSPSERYTSAAALAEDLRRFLDGQPVLARAPGWWAGFGRQAFRHRHLLGGIVLGLAAACLMMVVLGQIRRHRELTGETTAAFAQRRQAESKMAEYALQLARQQYAAGAIAAGQAALAGDDAFAAGQLSNLMPAAGQADLRGWEWHYLHALTHRRPLRECSASTEAYQMALAPGGEELAAVGRDGHLRWYDARQLLLKRSTATGQGEINGVDYAPDGKTVATAGDDGSVCLFDAASGKQRLRIEAHTVKAFGVRFDATGRRLATCGEEGTIRLWETVTGQTLGVLEGHAADSHVEMLACSVDRRYLASAGSDRVVRLWDFPEGRPIHRLTGHQMTVAAVAFSPDGRWLASGSVDRSVIVWDCASGRQLAGTTLLDPVQSVAFSTSGQMLMVGDRAGSLHRFRLREGSGPEAPLSMTRDENHGRWHAHAGRIWNLCPHGPNDAWLTSGADQRLRAWEAEALTGFQRALPAPEGQLFRDVQYTPDGQELLLLNEAAGVAVHDARSLRPLRRLTADGSDWYCLCVLPGRDEVAAGNAHGQIAVWNYRRGHLRQRITLDSDVRIGGLAYAPSSGLLAVLPHNLSQVRLYRVEDGTLVRRIQTGNQWSLGLAPDGRHLVVDLPGRLVVFEVATGRPVRSMAGHTGSVYSLAYSPDGTRLASAGTDRSVRLWSTEGTLLYVLTGHATGLECVRFSTRGHRLFSADSQGGLKVADVATQQVLLSFTLACDRLFKIAIAPDQRQLAAVVQRGVQGWLVVLGPSAADATASIVP